MRNRSRLVTGAGASVGAALAALPSAAAADTFTVDNTNATGPGSLEQAVDDAESNFGFDRVLFNTGLTGNIALQDDLDIEDSVEIVGPGSNRVTVTAASGDRIFTLFPQFFPPQVFTKVTISGLTLTGGEESSGGAIAALGVDLTVLDSVISGNTADDTGGGISAIYGNIEIGSTTLSGNSADYGGAIGTYLGSTVSINNSTVSGNTAEEDGGGLFTALGESLLITNSTIAGNTATYSDGGGLLSFASHTTLSNSTVSGNSAEDGGGLSSVDYGIPTPTKLTARNSTIAGNTASDDGGGIDADGFSHAFTLNTIVATNTAPDDGPNVDGLFESGFGLFDDTPAGITETTPGSNLFNANPQLGALANNGGPTQTRALADNSPALDAGDGTGSKHDQRGQTRPIELPGIPNSAAAGADGSDIGAVELQSLSGGTAGVVAASDRKSCFRKARKKFAKAKRSIATKINRIADPQLRSTKRANKIRKAKKKRRVRFKWCRRNFS